MSTNKKEAKVPKSGAVYQYQQKTIKEEAAKALFKVKDLEKKNKKRLKQVKVGNLIIETTHPLEESPILKYLKEKEELKQLEGAAIVKNGTS